MLILALRDEAQVGPRAGAPPVVRAPYQVQAQAQEGLRASSESWSSFSELEGRRRGFGRDTRDPRMVNLVRGRGSWLEPARGPEHGLLMVPNQGLRNILLKGGGTPFLPQEGARRLSACPWGQLCQLQSDLAGCGQARVGTVGGLEGPSGFPLPGLDLWMKKPWSSRVSRADGSRAGHMEWCLFLSLSLKVNLFLYLAALGSSLWHVGTLVVACGVWFPDQG